MPTPQHPPPAVSATLVWQIVDADGDGYVTRDELMNYFKISMYGARLSVADEEKGDDSQTRKVCKQCL